MSRIRAERWSELVTAVEKTKSDGMQVCSRQRELDDRPDGFQVY